MIDHIQPWKRRAFVNLVIGAGLVLGACSWIPKGEPQFDVGIKDRGTASWYGEQFHGRQAANGTIYDMEGLTAAHRTFPLGSMVRVVNLTNGKYIFVQITDRGPYMNGRILDLSHAAAVRLGMERGGLSLVQVEIVGERRPEFLLSSDAVPTLAHALVVRMDATDQPAEPLLNAPVRLLPTDLWVQRRTWRNPATLESDDTALALATALIVE